MTFQFLGDVDFLKRGIQELSGTYQYSVDKDGFPVTVQNEPDSSIRVVCKNGRASITYGRKIHFFRAFGLLLERLQKGESEFELTEQPQFDMNGPMFDVSQGNAVIRVEGVKNIIRRMAIMGLDTLMMYCEDSYDVKNQPYFGYMRARYTEEELRECDEYADLFGIEMIPCIQTLAHLTDVLKWNVFDDIREDGDTLLVGDEGTYRFIEELIRAAVKPFKTKKIHIGMDEAWKLGLGTYLKKHGLTDSGRIMREHLQKVMEIVRRLDLQPMMWSDMFFKSFANGDYYDSKAQVPQELAEQVPKDISFVYWDYYHFDEAFYSDFIDKHRKFGEPIFAGGIWTWTGFAANWGMTLRTTNPALMACKKKDVKRVLATVWGDNGTECNVFATLLGLSLFAEHGYAYQPDSKKVQRRFEFCTGAKYKDFYNLKYLDEVPGCKEDNLEQVNPSKYLMWQDILTGLFDKNIEGLPLNAHYTALAAEFEAAADRNGEYNELFRFNYHVANVLAVKSEIGIQLKKAYRDKDRNLLGSFQKTILPELSLRVQSLRRAHKKIWFRTYKALGWDIMDMRYGALLARIESAGEEIGEYLSGELDRIDELEEERLYYNGKAGLVPYANFYGKIVSPSRIAPEA